jgi:hypothetical protein
MAVLNLFDCFLYDLGTKQHDFSNDTVKVYLTNTAPSASDEDKADLAGITEENGYAATDITAVWSQEADGSAELDSTDVVITASGGSFGPFRYAVFYNETHATDRLMGYYDYGVPITVPDGQPFTIDFPLPLFKLAAQ